MLLVQRLDELAEVSSHHALERKHFGRDDIHCAVRIARTERRGDLEANEARTDYHRVRSVFAAGDDGATVAQRAQVVDERQIGAWSR
jgi:hypothetical protein